MNYRHGYHAGNFADVHKHIVLIASLQALFKKDSALMVLDTHAGRGQYDLRVDAQKSQEYLSGISKIIEHKNLPASAMEYLQARASLCPDPLHYPGSPRFIQHLLRTQDRAAFCELEPAECRFLTRLVGRDKRIGVHQRDGYEAIKALLPPAERRGLVLIDPPFEQADEYLTLLNAAREAYRVFANGVYLIWYPLKADQAYQRFCQSLKLSGIRKILNTQLWVEPKDSPVGLLGSGLILINPPWQLDQVLERELPSLAAVLADPKHAEATVSWLVGE
jgi:23S rRNA (adenine2030-N6)-methyltransferase